MIFVFRMERKDVEEQAYGSADDWSAEAVGGGPEGLGRSPRGGRTQVHDLTWKAKYGGMDVSEAQEAR